MHNNYLETFKNYRELIKSADKTTDIKSSILDKIKEDSIFTENLREKLYRLSKLSEEPIVGEFIDAILRYTWDAPNELHYRRGLHHVKRCNTIRFTLINELEYILDGKPKIDKIKRESATGFGLEG